MINALPRDKDLVVSILTRAFDDNKSFNAIVKQDSKRVERIKSIFRYYFETCLNYGRVFLADDRKACAMVMFPDSKKTTIKSVWMDINLAFLLGFKSVRTGFAREAKLSLIHPKDGRIYYLLFIGVEPEYQNQGIGKKLLREIINDSIETRRTIYLETYLEKNLDLYQRLGFDIYDEVDFGFPVYCLKRLST